MSNAQSKATFNAVTLRDNQRDETGAVEMTENKQNTPGSASPIKSHEQSDSGSFMDRIRQPGNFWLITITVSLGAIFLRLLAQQFIPPSSLLVLPLLAVIFCAYVGGLGPGLLATAIPTVSGFVFLLWAEPAKRPEAITQLFGFIFLGVIFTVLCERRGPAIVRIEEERRRAQANADAAHAAEQRLHLLLDGIKDYTIAMLDPQGKITSWNAGGEHIQGWRTEEIYGQSFHTLYRTEDQAAALPEQILGTALRTGRSELEGWLVRRDGSSFRAHTVIAPVFDEAERLRGFALIAADITARIQAEEVRREAEEAQRETENHFRLLAESLPQLVWTCQSDGQYDFLSRQWVEYTGIPAEDQLGLGWLHQVHPDDCERVMDAWKAAIQSNSDFRLEFRIRRHDGIYRWFDTRAVRLLDAEGQTIKWFGSNTDIDERKRAEESQLRTQKMEALGTLAGGIAHDFNNILLSITGNTRLALSDLPTGHPAYDNLAEIAKASGRATELVRRILTFSRQQEPKRVVVQLRPVVEEAMKLLRSTLPAMVELRGDFTADVSQVAADTTQVFQIIMNLATNASHAIGSGKGVIELRLDAVNVNAELAGTNPDLHEGAYTRLSVSDDGCGMDKETIARIFDPFFTTKPMGQGTGLGLSVVEGIMKGHGGAVTVYSQPDKGTTFRLYFPAVEAPVEKTVTERPKISSSGGESILYVDDEESLVMLAGRILKRLGYKVTGQTNPMHALAKFRSSPYDYDLVVTDLSMPGMSGFELIRELLAIRPDIPIVLTSGYIRPEDNESALQNGVRATIMKPNTIEELGRTLEQILRNPSNSANR